MMDAPPGDGTPGRARAGRRQVPVSCYDRALRLLARRFHFERELQLKLAQRGYPAGEVAETSARLRQEGYLDDRRAAEEWLRVRRRRGDGPRRLAAGLARLGLEREAIAEHLDAGGEDGENARARAVAERWLSRQAGRPGAVDPAALARHLDRRGFGRRDILSVLGDLQLPARELPLEEDNAG
ncbi:MAG TPA: RecX family transcriptional regulator [Thermoanaerobaculia bacterium]|nr:RecX family transcriptional regulator [Thermoanaerobaculia bacterium]